jgi:hypothetical protein
MKERYARRIAAHAHRGGSDRFGEPMIDHVGRVAAAVSDEARPMAWLHDVLEGATVGVADLRRAGLTGDELETLALLTRHPGRLGYLDHARTISSAPGTPGRLAREIKLADLADRIEQSGRALPHAAPPPYAEALAVLVAAQRAATLRDEAAPAPARDRARPATRRAPARP